MLLFTVVSLPDFRWMPNVVRDCQFGEQLKKHPIGTAARFSLPSSLPISRLTVVCVVKP
jgi:hypothetical protein